MRWPLCSGGILHLSQPPSLLEEHRIGEGSSSSSFQFNSVCSNKLVSDLVLACLACTRVLALSSDSSSIPQFGVPRFVEQHCISEGSPTTPQYSGVKVFWDSVNLTWLASSTQQLRVLSTEVIILVYSTCYLNDLTSLLSLTCN